jgi:L-seryl-tRNA(Ser) seleniumtransferase
MAATVDRFGNPLDLTVGYARGTILRGTDEEVAKTLHARRLVRERIETDGVDTIYDLTGMNRGAGLSPEDAKQLTSHLPFFASFEGEAEPLAIRHMGGDPRHHDALILNRVSAANFIALITLLGRGDRVVALAPAGGVTHPSVTRPVEMASATIEEFHDVERLAADWTRGGEPRLLVITPISASKRHLELEAFRRALALPRGARTVVYVDDAHLASRIGFFGDPPTFALGPVDLAVCSADKHVAGPRAGVLVGRKDLVRELRSRAFELGLEAQTSQYVGVANALRQFEPKVIARAGELAKEVLSLLQARYGRDRVYLGGPGVSITGEDALDIARELGGGRDASLLVPVEANTIVAMEMLSADGMLTISAVAMPGSAPVVRLMMYPDGHRLGVERIAESLDRAFVRLARARHDLDEARRMLLGDHPRR